MDNAVFESLRSALRASPDNRDLALVVLRAALDRNHPAELEQLLNELKLDRTQLADAERRDLGRAYLSIGKPAQAIEWLQSDDSETLLLKARAFAQIGDLDQGR